MLESLRNTAAYWNGPLLDSQGTFCKVYLNPPHDDNSKTKRCHLRQKKSVDNEVKGVNIFKVADINWMTSVHLHHFLEDQQAGEIRSGKIPRE